MFDNFAVILVNLTQAYKRLEVKLSIYGKVQIKSLEIKFIVREIKTKLSLTFTFSDIFCPKTNLGGATTEAKEIIVH